MTRSKLFALATLLAATMLSASRPPLTFWNVAAICAVSVGETLEGRIATRNFSERVSRASAAVRIQGSSQDVPTGVSAPSKPR